MTTKQILLKAASVLSYNEKRKYGLLILSNITIVIIDLASLAALLVFINQFTTAGRGSVKNLPTWLQSTDPLILIGAFLGFFALKNILALYLHQIQQSFVYGIASRISRDKLRNYFGGAYSNYIQIDTAVHIEEICRHPSQFANYILGGILQLFTELVIISLTILIILLFNFKLFIGLFILFFIPTVFISYLLKKRLKPVRNQVISSGEKTLQYLKEALAGFEESNIYGKNEYFTNRYDEFQRNMNNNLATLQTVQVIPNRLMEVFAVMALLILVVLNRYTNLSNASDFLNIGAFMVAAYKIIPGIVKILNINSHIKTYGFVVESITKREESELAKTPSQNTELIESITLRNSAFGYTENHKVIEKLSFHLERGALIGVKGVSGKGKTTLINLLLGFLDPDGGEILFNNKIMNALERQGYWKNIAYVKQQSFIIHDTILGNILLDNTPNPDLKKLKQALTISGLDEVISNLPEGLNTILAENGKNISGGQRQRISIARALYKDAGVIIMDEPFNELDEASEQKMLGHFKRIAQSGKLVLLITHNHQSLEACDKILSLDFN